MKVSIGYNEIRGPFGGGINFSRQLKNYLKKNGIEVISDLDSDNIDIILLTEPRRYTQSSAFNHLDVVDYLKNTNKEAIVVNRINECDERKNTKGLNQFLINSSRVADHTVFISNWLSELFIKQGFRKEQFSVIRNGADEKYFFPNQVKQKPKKFKIVTHHWGASQNKGIKAYKEIDNLLDNDDFKYNFEFTFIGNLPSNVQFNNCTVLNPMDQMGISNFLRECHIYITGSENEPAGMHHIEGAMSGLPILYLESGGITEYCRDYGLSYKISNLGEKILEISSNYSEYRKKLDNYIFTGEEMNKQYLNLFNKLIDNRQEIYTSRKHIKKRYLKNQYKLGNKYFYIKKLV
tara:strand:+ start:375 stop:1421 length:1047 start_codon:yes stop_codon:yes gene_type:complete